jgi:SpoVK/Ycf46/Vps4 family AAA+-type ATPase
MIKAALSLLTTESSWDDLLLTKKAFQQVNAISNQLQNNKVKGKQTLVKTTGSVSPVLFYGPQVNEQMITAVLIGKGINKSVCRIDLSKLVSKYIGETEKNLNALFDAAEKKDWILFFDEADALFGKRTDIKDSHDRYANLDVNYLLQSIENYPGLCLFATNKKNKFDTAFTRRLRSVIYFPRQKKKNS